jgi:hypothetical protein
MKITFCVSPLFHFKQFTVASRTLTSNLLRNDKLDTQFNYSILDVNRIYNQKAIDMQSEIAKFNEGLSRSFITWKEWVQCFLASKEYAEKFVDSLNTDIVLMSCAYGQVEYPFVVEMLNRGLKVLLGGSNFRYWGTEEYVKNFLLKLGVKEKYLKNLIIVYGFVDLTTNLYDIIKKWKTTKIVENDFTTLWKCDDDYNQNIIKIASTVLNFNPHSLNLRDNFTQSIFLLNNKCWWKKCKFCTYWKLPKMDFDSGVSAETIAGHILRSNKKFGSNQVYIANDYFIFNRKNIEVLEILKENKQLITIFSGIKLLQNERYLENLNKYINFIKVGLESGTDFALDYINKGYGVKEVEDAFEKMSRILKKSLNISYNIIVDLPQRNKQEVIKNYQNALRWKNMLIDNNFEYVHTTALSLAIVDTLNDPMVDNKFIKESSVDDCNSGRVFVFEILRKALGDGIDRILYNDLLPFVRFDENGNKMPSDFDILPIELIEELLGNWGWGSKNV